MKNHVKQGVFVACAGFGAMAFVLAASPARAADPSPTTTTTTTEGMGFTGREEGLLAQAVVAVETPL